MSFIDRIPVCPGRVARKQGVSVTSELVETIGGRAADTCCATQRFQY